MGISLLALPATPLEENLNTDSSQLTAVCLVAIRSYNGTENSELQLFLTFTIITTSSMSCV